MQGDLLSKKQQIVMLFSNIFHLFLPLTGKNKTKLGMEGFPTKDALGQFSVPVFSFQMLRFWRHA